MDHLLVEGLADYAIFVVSPSGVILRWNLGAKALFGYSGSEVVGQHFRLLFTPEDVSARAPEFELASAEVGPTTGYDRWHVRKDGSRFWGMNTAQPLYVTAQPPYHDRRRLIGFAKIVRDLTERHIAAEAQRDAAARLRALVERTQHAALHDDLTGLANKALFREYLRRAIARVERRQRHSFAVLFLDLDNFKAVNDRFGHIPADGLLMQVARRLERAIREEDVVGRVGGDEFAVLIEDIEDASEAIAAAEQLLRAFRPSFIIGENDVATSASIGIALAAGHSPQTVTADRLLEDADLAMYQAKAKGRSRYVLFDDGMRVCARAAVQLDHALREAFERDEFRVFYQPIADVRSARIDGFQLSAGWQHPERGLLLQTDFHERAEETGLSVDINRWLLSRAARQLELWQRERVGLGQVTLSVSFSAKEFERPALAAELREMLAGTALPPHSLAIELADTPSLESYDRVFALLAEIKALGLDVFLGDSGAEMSWFTYVSGLPVSGLKIGAPLVCGLESDGNGKSVAIVRAMIAFARSLGMRCIAEGVATVGQFAALAALGCDAAQGSLVSPPVEAEAARALLDSDALRKDDSLVLSRL